MNAQNSRTTASNWNALPFRRSLVALVTTVSLLSSVTASAQTIATEAKLTLASLLTDRAVLQRDQPVPIWGSAEAGAKVTVEFGGQQKLTTVDADGTWKLSLDPMQANANPQELSASSAESTLTISDVVVGEVWICSGQSNMKMERERCPDMAPLVAAAENLRSFKVRNAVAFAEQDRCEGKWNVAAPNSAVAFAFAYHLEQHADVPIGIIETYWGSSSIEAWMPRDMAETVPHFKTVMEEFDADTKMRDQIQAILDKPKGWSGREDILLRRQPNILYNAMMHPLAPYACRGLVWYQGERNTKSMFGLPPSPWFARNNSGMLKYGETLKAWIKRYRKEWGDEKMHFLVVMLPGYYKPLRPEPGLKPIDKGPQHAGSHSWAWMRESQLSAAELPSSSVVNTIDLGHKTNLHPTDKLPIGQRLALLAARDTLGMELEANGPTFKEAVVNGENILIRFDHHEGLKTNDGKAPAGFWLSDDSQNWVSATAAIKDGSVELHSPQLKKPLYVRYAFAGKPNVNLVNEADLPAYPFRTDRFEP